MKKVIDEAVDLLRVVERFEFEELELEVKGMRFHLSRGAAAAHAPSHAEPARPADPIPAQAGGPEPEPAREEEAANTVPITSPMVGMFYRAAAPDKPPFVDVGQIVEMDQPVCIIEAMKLMNIIKASVRGKIAKVMVENQTPVQAGQPLFLVEPL